jgi:acetyl esterase/lipase
VAGLLVALAALWIALWIVLPAPNYFMLTFGVGGPEVSAILIVGSLAAIALSARQLDTSLVARIAVGCAACAILLSLSVWARLSSTITRFNDATRHMSFERLDPPDPRRSAPVVFVDLFRPIRVGSAKITRNIEFAKPGGVPLHVDVYQPSAPGSYGAAGPHAIVIQIYGGAWQRGEPASDGQFATWLAAHNYVVFAVDYRHAPAWKWPAQINDVDSALVWVAHHAAEFGGDASRVVLIGRSAGAHLATMAAWRTQPIPVRGVVSFYGPADLATSYQTPPRPDPIHTRAVEEALLGGPLDAMPERYADASTITFVRRATSPLPPSLLIYGARDHIVEAKYGAAITDALRASHTPVAYLEIPWAEHAFDAVFNGPSSQLSLYYIERFIAWAVR